MVVADPAQSQLSVSSEFLAAAGSSQVTVTVELRDEQGLPLTSGGQFVSIYQIVDGVEPGARLDVTDNGDGTYSAIVTGAGAVAGQVYEFAAYLGLLPEGDFEIKGGAGAKLEIVDVPSAPDLASATPSPSSVVLEWEEPALDGGLPVTDYRVEFSTDGAAWTVFEDGASAVPTTEVTGLSSSTNYLFRVAAGNNAGYGPYSVVLALATIPSTQEVLAANYGLIGAAADLAADADVDGKPNLLEYTLGSDPTTPTTLADVVEFEFAPDSGRITAVVRVNADLSITPMVSSNLKAWSPEAVELSSSEVSQEGVPAGFERRSWEVSTADSHLFIRMQVTHDDD